MLRIKDRCVRKLFGFPRDDTRSFGVNFRLLDKVVAYKTVERSDDSIAKKVAIYGGVPWLDDAGCNAGCGASCWVWRPSCWV